MPPATVRAFTARLGNFTHVSDRRYVMDIPTLGVNFDLGHIRRERHEFWGELIVRCSLAGARTIDGVLSAADFNCSGLQSRTTRAKFLAERAQTKPDEIDWLGLVEEFCQRVIKFDQEGTSARAFVDIPASTSDAGDEWHVDGVPLLAQHPVIWFGDGGAAKSMLALHVAAELARSGQRVLYADWEFSGGDHRARLDRLCANRAVPGTFWYIWCSRPLVDEIDRIAAVVAREQITYIVCDSVSFACAGAPESAEAASNYFRALRALKIGSLNIAHITKGDEQSAHKYPFGSIFWHDGAKATWFLKRADEKDNGDLVEVAFIQRKANIGRKRRQALGFRLAFSEDAIDVRAFDVSTHAELSLQLPLWQRMRAECSKGSVPTKELADRLDTTEAAIRQVVHRMDMFVRTPHNNGIALSAGHADERKYGTE